MNRAVVRTNIFSIILTLSLFLFSSCSFNKQEQGQPESKLMDLAQVSTFLDELYEGITGFGIPSEESEMIRQKGGAPTYGEIKYESLNTIFSDLPITSKDIFYDLGSGVGKTVLQAYLTFPFKKAIGIELSKKRYYGSMAVLKKLKIKNMVDKNREIWFEDKNFTDTNFSDATVIYMCSTCYSDDLLHLLGKKFAELAKGAYIISLKSMPDLEKYNLKLIKNYQLPMTWSSSSSVSVYQVV